MEFNKELWNKSEKILNAISGMYSCCGDTVCRKGIKKNVSVDILNNIEFSRIKDIDYDFNATLTFIIYETLRLSQTKKNKWLEVKDFVNVVIKNIKQLVNIKNIVLSAINH